MTAPAGGETLTLFGIDAASVPLAVRERVTCGADEAQRVLAAAAARTGLGRLRPSRSALRPAAPEPWRRGGKAAPTTVRAAASTIAAGGEAVIVSTCNRTELYVVGDGAEDVLAGVAGEAGWDPAIAWTRRDGLDAARHLFRVSAGLESSILGDQFITGQLKRALAIASAAGTAGPVLNRLFRQAFSVGRLARRTTALGRGEAGLGAAVAALVLARRRADARVVVLGAGETARDVVRQLTKRGCRHVAILNRTRDRAAAVAESCGVDALDWSALLDAVAGADVLVTATGATTPIVTADTLAAAAADLLIVDLGVPRNVAPIAGREPITIDEISLRQSEVLAQRRAAIPQVVTLVEQEVTAWSRWLWGRPLEHLLGRTFAEEERMRRRLAEAIVAHGWMESNDAAARFVAEFTRGMLKRHAAELRACLQ